MTSRDSGAAGIPPDACLWGCLVQLRGHLSTPGSSRRRLNAGVPATQVAAWAGHSVMVLLKVYAQCLEGQDELAMRNIDAAQAPPDGCST